MKEASLDESIFVLQIPENIGDVVAHLYEHLFIQSFYDFLEENGHNEAFFCDLQGETFRNAIYLYNNVTDKNVNALLRQFIDSGQLELALIDHCTEQLSCEMGVTYRIADKVGLERKLIAMHNIGFAPISSHANVEHEPKIEAPLKVDAEIAVVNNTDKTQIVTINYVLDKCSVEEMAIFSNIAPALVKMTNRKLTKIGAYYDCDVIDDELDDRVVLGIDYVLLARYDIKDVKSEVEKALDTELSTYTKDIEAYIQLPYRPAGLIYDYLSLGLKTSWGSLQSVLTIDNVKRVFKKVQIYSIDKYEYNKSPKELPLR